MKGNASRSNIGSQIDLMPLCSARNQRGDKRRADAAADIAHEIDQAGDAAAFLRRQAHVRSQVNGHEQEGQADDLYDPNDVGNSKADVKIDMQGGVIETSGETEPAERDEVARLKLAGEHANQRHREQQDD